MATTDPTVLASLSIDPAIPLSRIARALKFHRISWLCALASLMPAMAIASGSAHTLVVKSDGTVWAVGANSNGQIGDNTTTTRTTFVQVPGLANIVKVAAGAQHSMAITASGALYVWGDNAFGQVGDGSVVDRKTPVLLSLTGVTAIAAGEYHSVALKSNGDAYVWGKNVNGQVGNGNTNQVNAPALILKKVGAVGACLIHRNVGRDLR